MLRSVGNVRGERGGNGSGVAQGLDFLALFPF